MAVQALPLAISAAQTAFGTGQRIAADRRRRRAMDSFRFDIPDATMEQVGLARERASRTGLPGEDITRARLDSDMAGTLQRGESVAQTASDVLGLYGKMFGQKTDTERQLLESGAQYKSQNEMELMRSLGLLADAEAQQFHYNEYIPFLSEMGYAGEQAAGGAANIASGLQGAFQTWNNQFMMDEYSKIFGVGNTGSGGMPVETQFARDSLRSREMPRMEGQLPQSSSFGDMYQRTPTPPIPGNETFAQNTTGQQGLPGWQKENPLSYPANWVKYYNR